MFITISSEVLNFIRIYIYIYYDLHIPTFNYQTNCVIYILCSVVIENLNENKLYFILVSTYNIITVY